MTASPLTSRQLLGRFAACVLGGILALELFNSARMLATPIPNRRFPEQYVTKGIWSPYGLIRLPRDKAWDFSGPLLASGRALRHNPNLYEEFTGEGYAFIYPPTGAVLFLPFAWIAEKYSDSASILCFDLLCRTVSLCIALAVLLPLRKALQHWRDWLLGMLLIMAFFPIRWAVCCLNAQVLINAALVGAILAYACSHRVLLGVLLGLVCAVKPYLVVLVLFVIARREWRGAIIAVLTLGSVVLGSLLMVGTQPWKTYIHDLLPLMCNGYAAHGNQTLLAAIRRWYGDPTAANLIPLSSVEQVLGWMLSAVMIVVSVAPRPNGSWMRRATATQGRPSFSDANRSAELLYRAGDISIAAFASLLASPTAWDHHYGWAVVVFCVYLLAARQLCVPSRYHVLVGACYVLMGTDWVPVSANRPGLLSLLDSPKVAAAVALSAVLWYLCRSLTVQLRTTQTLEVPRFLAPHPAEPIQRGQSGDSIVGEDHETEGESLCQPAAPLSPRTRGSGEHPQ